MDEATGFVLDFSEPYYGVDRVSPPASATMLQNRPDANETYSGIELQLSSPSRTAGWRASASPTTTGSSTSVRGAIVNPNNETPGTNASGPGVAGSINAHLAVQRQRYGLASFRNRGGPQRLRSPGVSGRLFDRRFYVRHSRHGRPPPDRAGHATIGHRTSTWLDLQLSRAFPIGSTLTLTPQVACFNVFDSRTVLQREGFVGWYEIVDGERTFTEFDAFNDITSELGGRVLRGGVRITF